ncbi:MAG: ABC transporter substrate-binding protein, partial [Pseudomonadota bacterium]
MRNIFATFALIVLFYSSSGYAGDDSTCKRFFADMQMRVNSILLDKKASFLQKRATLTSIFENSVNVEQIARDVAKDYLNKASEQERKDFLNAYRPYLSDHYIGGLDEEDYNEMLNLVVIDFKPGDNSFYVATTQVKRTADDPMNFDIRLQEQPKGTCS